MLHKLSVRMDLDGNLLRYAVNSWPVGCRPSIRRDEGSTYGPIAFACQVCAYHDAIVPISSPGRAKSCLSKSSMAEMAEGSSKPRNMTPSLASRTLSRRGFSSARICAELATPELAHKLQFSVVLQVCSFARRQVPLQAAALVLHLKTART